LDDEEPICRRVFLIRHGHYDRVDDLGDTVWGLSPLGRRQATRLARRLVQVAGAVAGRFEGVYASPWPRATQTAEITARALDLDRVVTKPYLHECQPLVDSEDHVVRAIHPSIPPTSVEDREATCAHIARVRDRFFATPKRASKVLVFTHGNVVRAVVTATLGLPLEAWASMDIAHCSITEIRVYASGFEILASYNETGHLPPSLVTTA
jgi:broad specificity phosphatase PhoE